MGSEPDVAADVAPITGVPRVEALLRDLGAGDGEFLHQVIGDLLFAAPDMLRSTTGLLIAETLGAGDDDRVVRFAAAVQIVYAAMHTHQQVRLAHEPAGGNLVVLAGDYLYAQAAVIAAGLEHLPVMALLSEAIKEICRQGLDGPLDALADDEASREPAPGAVGLFELSAGGAALLAAAPAAAVIAAGRYGAALDTLASARTPAAARASIVLRARDALGGLPGGVARRELERLPALVHVPAWAGEAS